ncbi:hypothetical protein [Chryseobacterium taiwanense]|uniref:Uncharacterized protein n=1 Tax=Chryseobacterium taiwanense TaxID=363331 RepID=A0A0B4EA57_9FLAO|nr:hypothetical protein [Chryseobacterium taiwanense]KIC63518.1 hypothetical protein RM51_07560 [Chryseobacterium taiwanense]
MRLFFTIIFFFFSFTRILATEQQSDILYMNGEKYYILNKILNRNIIENYIEEKNIKYEINSSLWRGYIANYEIINNTFQIKDILIPVYSSKNNFIKLKDKDKTLFESLNQIKTNTVLILSKKNISLYHLEDQTAKIKVIEIQNNKIVKNFDMNSFEDFTKFRNEQFQKYKLTDLYKKDLYHALRTVQSSRERHHYGDDWPIEKEVEELIINTMFENENFNMIL